MPIKVQLVNVAGGDLSIVNSARVSFAKEVAMVSQSDERLIRYLAKHQHMTPFRHNFIQLRCSVPLFLARQLMKHQAGLTWNEVSRRYVDDLPEFYSIGPRGWRARPEDGIKQGSGDLHANSEYYNIEYKKLETAAKNLYVKMINGGVAPELARTILPQSMLVEFIWSGNLLAFSHVYNLRAGEGAQVEAKLFAEKLDEQIKPEFPIGWESLTNTGN